MRFPIFQEKHDVEDAVFWIVIHAR